MTNGDAWQIVEEIEGETRFLRDVEFGPNNDYLAYSTTDDKVHIVDTSDWSLETTLEEASSTPEKIGFSPNAEFIAYTSGSDVFVHEVGGDWSLETTLEEASSTGSISVRFSRDSALIAYGDGDGNVYIHQTSDWSLETTLNENNNEVEGIDFSEDNGFIAYASGLDVFVHNVSDWSLEETLEQASETVRTVKFSYKESGYISYSGTGEIVYVHNVSDWSLEAEIGEDFITDTVNEIDFSKDDEWMVYGQGAVATESSTYVHEIGADFELVQELDELNDDTRNGVSVSFDNELVAYTTDEIVFVHYMALKPLVSLIEPEDEVVKDFDEEFTYTFEVEATNFDIASTSLVFRRESDNEIIEEVRLDGVSKAETVEFSINNIDDVQLEPADYDWFVDLEYFNTIRTVGETRFITIDGPEPPEFTLTSPDDEASFDLLETWTFEFTVDAAEESDLDDIRIVFRKDGDQVTSHSVGGLNADQSETFTVPLQDTTGNGLTRGVNWRVEADYDIITSVSETREYSVDVVEFNQEISDASDTVWAVATDPNESWLSVTDASGTPGLRVYDIENGFSLEQEFSNVDEGRDVDFSRNGEWMAVIEGSGQECKVYEVGTWDLIETFTFSDDQRSCRFSRDNKFLAAGGRNDDLKIIDTSDWTVHTNISSTGESVQGIDWSENHEYLAVSDFEDEEIRIYDVDDDFSLTETISLNDTVRRLAFDYDNNYLALANLSEETYRIYSQGDWEELQVIDTDGGSAQGVGFTRKTNYMVTSPAADEVFKVYDTSEPGDFTELVVLDNPSSNAISSLFSMRDRYLLGGDTNGNCFIYDFESAIFDVEITGTNSPVTIGSTLQVESDIENTGTARGTQTIELSFDDENEVVDEKDLSVSRGFTEQVENEYSIPLSTEDGEYTVYVSSLDDADSTTVEVNDPDVQITLISPEDEAVFESDTVTFEVEFDTDGAEGDARIIVNDEIRFSTFLDGSQVEIVEEEISEIGFRTGNEWYADFVLGGDNG